MITKCHRPTVKKVSETYFGKRLADPEVLRRYTQTVQLLRNAVKEEIELIERSERLTAEDFAVVINARAEDLYKP